MEYFLNMDYGEKEAKSMKNYYLFFCKSRTNMRYVFPVPVYGVKIRPGHKRWIKKISYWINSYYGKLCISMIYMV